MPMTERNGRATTWSYLVEFLTQGRNPWDRGVLDAHWYTAAPTAQLRTALTRAKTQRRRILAFVSSWRRQYLDGLIWGLEKELERRIRVNEA